MRASVNIELTIGRGLFFWQKRRASSRRLLRSSWNAYPLTNRSVPRLVFAGTMQVTKRALEILDLAFVVDLLSLGEFQRLEHFLHFIE